MADSGWCPSTPSLCLSILGGMVVTLLWFSLGCNKDSGGKGQPVAGWTSTDPEKSQASHRVAGSWLT